jgi:hypothetical protein
MNNAYILTHIYLTLIPRPKRAYPIPPSLSHTNRTHLNFTSLFVIEKDGKTGLIQHLFGHALKEGRAAIDTEYGKARQGKARRKVR